MSTSDARRVCAKLIEMVRNKQNTAVGLSKYFVIFCAADSAFIFFSGVLDIAAEVFL